MGAKLVGVAFNWKRQVVEVTTLCGELYLRTNRLIAGMNPAQRLIPPLITMLVIASCGVQETRTTLNTVPRATDDSPTPYETTPLPLAEKPSEPIETATRLVRAQWALVGQRGSTLEIRYALGGGCQKFDHIEKRETSKEVEVRVMLEETYVVRGYGACTLALGIRGTDVGLSRPLGKRVLIGECTEQDIFCDDLRRTR